MDNGATVEEHINAAIAKIGEKLHYVALRLLKKETTLHSVRTYTWVVALLY